MYKPQEVINVAGYAAEIMMINGGETYRTEEMINYISSSAGMDRVSSFVTPTVVIISAAFGDEPPETIVRRLKERGTNLEKVSLVNDFSRKIASEKWEYKKALQQLKEIDNKPYSLNRYWIIGAAGLASGIFTVFLGGVWADAIPSIITSIIIQSIINLSFVKQLDFFSDFIGGFLAALIGVTLVGWGLGINLDRIIIGAIIPLVPGVSITNAVRDAIKGELLSGVTRSFEAFWVSVAIAAGVAASFYLFG